MNKSILFGVIATVFWGLATVVAKKLLFSFEPLSLLLVQLIASNIFLWLTLVFLKTAKLPKKLAFKHSLLGLLQPGIAFILGVFGLNLTTADNDAMLWASESLVIIFLSWLFLRERLSWQFLLLAMIGSIGTILAIMPNSTTLAAPYIVLGNLLVVAGVLCAAIYAVVTHRQLIIAEPLHLIALHQLSALVLVAVVWLVSMPLTKPFSYGTTQSDLVWASLWGVLGYGLSFWLYLITIKGIGAARSGILLVLPPIFTLIGSFFFLNETLNTSQFIGVIIALLAVGTICILKMDNPKIVEQMNIEEELI